MASMDEARAIEQVSARLAERFPAISVETVRGTVHQVHQRFDGRVRDYVPVLVERAARESLRALSATADRMLAPS